MWTLSVCIPVYNSDVRTLVATLCAQIDQLGTSQIDIFLIDDASEAPFVRLNQSQNSLVHYIGLKENIGRSKIRNAFLQHTTAQFLLFIDGDSSIRDPQFLAKYVQFLEAKDVDVLVGASVYDAQQPEPRFRLRWRYSTQRESLSYERRMQSREAGFKTNNFIVRRSILEHFPFEERLTGYGHEDTLFGLQLVAHKIPIQHLANPVWNLKLDTNEEFLAKTESALRNLLWLQKNAALCGIQVSNRLLQYHQSIEKSRLLYLLVKLLNKGLFIYKALLKSGRAPLFVFDLYRLLRLQELAKNTPNDLR
jgi:glycosyltransferase involved in cell wall biosynthesis